MKYFMSLVAVCLIVVISFFIMNMATAGTDRLVPSQYGTIQAAINACSAGDTVIVADGTYTGTYNKNLIIATAITVKSENGPEGCIIDCQNSGRGFYLSSSSANGAVIEGFTIRNGNAVCGGGIYCYTSCSPTIKNCIIEDCSTSGSGGGIYCNGSCSPTIENCEIKDNTAAGTHGGGICAEVYCSPVITNCKISGNTASTNAGGGCSFYYGGTPTLTNCLIVGNDAATAGGGIYFHYGSDPTLTNCTISDNTAVNGGGVFAWYSYGTAYLKNCIIWGNEATTNGDELYVTYCTVNMSYSCYDISQGQPADVYVYGALNTSNCITDDPEFLRGSSGMVYMYSYLLDWDSPCIDAGNNSYITGIEKDLEGALRKFDGKNDGSITVDMGAYEWGAKISDWEPSDLELCHPEFEEEFDVDYGTGDVVPLGLDIRRAKVYKDGSNYVFEIETKASIQSVFDTYGNDVQFTIHLDTNSGQASDKIIITTSSTTAVLTTTDYQVQNTLSTSVDGNSISISVPSTAIGDQFIWAAFSRFALSPGQAAETSAIGVYVSPVVDKATPEDDIIFCFWVDWDLLEAEKEEVVFQQGTGNDKNPQNPPVNMDFDNDSNPDTYLQGGYYKDKWKWELWELSDGTKVTAAWQDSDEDGRIDPGEDGGWIHRCPFNGGRSVDRAPVPKEDGSNVEFEGMRNTTKDLDADDDGDGRTDQITYHSSKNSNKITVVAEEYEGNVCKSRTEKVIDRPQNWSDLPYKKEDLFEIVTTQLPDGMVDWAYSEELKHNTTVEASSCFDWDKTGGSMPAGIEDPTDQGIVAGDPTTAETKQFQVKVTYDTEPKDIVYPIAPATHTVTLTILPALEITEPDSNLGTFALGQNYNIEIVGEGGTEAPYDTWTKSAGNLPPGMSISKDAGSGQGVFSGIPTQTGQYTFTVKVTDGKYYATKEFSVTVTDQGGGGGN